MPPIADQPPPILAAVTGRRSAWEILTEHVGARYPSSKRPASIAALVLNDMLDRDKIGRERYGTPLTAGNGRNQLVDAYHEALDLAVYLTAYLDEVGYPPLAMPPSDTSIPWDIQRARNKMPDDVFNLHELLRSHIANLFQIREVILERDQAHHDDHRGTP